MPSWTTPLFVPLVCALATARALCFAPAAGADPPQTQEKASLMTSAPSLTPWLQLGPSLQYVQPGRSRIDHTLVLGTRLQIDF